jgi:hypothetical protein
LRRLLFKETERSRDVSDKHGKIRCPKCGWQPSRSDRWMCKCEHLWNTFDTRGVCPACAYQWRDTKCPSCHNWSPHDDWYAQ